MVQGFTLLLAKFAAVLTWLGTRRSSDDGHEGSVVGCAEHDGAVPLLRAAAAGYCFSHWLCAPRLPRRQFLRPVALYGMHSNFEKLPLCSDGGTFASDTIRRCPEQYDPHEDLRGSLSAAVFVPWYNAHPDFVGIDTPLDTDTAVVIGAGNVAMDVARMLALEPSELDPTDTADHAIDALKKSNIRKVYISARRGPEYAAFTSPELRDLPKLEHTNVHMSKRDIEAAIVRAGMEPEKDVKSNLDAMLLIAENPKNEHERTMEFLFQHTPKEILGSDRVEGIVYSTPNGDVTIKCGLVITAIGYQAQGIDGVPYENGKVVNTDGRVSENLYVVGWAKRGPSGVIGTNKSDAAAVIELLVSDLKAPKDAGDISELLTHQVVVTQELWQKINEAEVAAGEPKGKPRVKSVERAELLKHAGL